MGSETEFVKQAACPTNKEKGLQMIPIPTEPCKREIKHMLNFICRPPRGCSLVLLVFALMFGLLSTEGCPVSFGAPPDANPVMAKPKPQQDHIRGMLKKLNDEADGKIHKARQRCIEELHKFFEEKLNGVDPFVEDALGWYSTYYWAYSWFDGGEAHRQYLENCFKTHLFTEKDCAQKIHEIVQTFLKDVADIENEMLLKLKEDLQDIPEVKHLDLDKLKKPIEERLAKIPKLCRRYLAEECAIDTLTFFVGEYLGSIVMKHLANRLGISIVVESGTRLGSIVFKSGNVILTIILGCLIDYALDWVVRKIYDPEAELKKGLKDAIQELEATLIGGEKDSESGKWKNGLDQELRDFITERSKIRERVILEQLGVNP